MLINRKEPGQNESLVANHSSLPESVVPGILGSPAKEEHTETNGQNEETSIDVTESTIQAHQQQLVLSAKSAHPSAPYQVPNIPWKPMILLLSKVVIMTCKTFQPARNLK